MKYFVLMVLTIVSASAFSLEVNHTEKQIELIDGGKSILKIDIDPTIHKQYQTSTNQGKIKYLDPIAHIYGNCAVINYGNAMYDTDGSESEINLAGNTYVYEIKTAALKDVITNFSSNSFTILNSRDHNFRPTKSALLISQNEGFVEKSYVLGTDCSVKNELKIPQWNFNYVMEHNGIAYVVLGFDNRVIVEISNGKIVTFKEDL